MSSNGGQPSFARCLTVSLASTLYIWGSCLLTEFCQVQNSLCVQVLCSILAVSLHGTRAVVVSQTLQRGIFTRQGGHPVRHWVVELSSSNLLFAIVFILKALKRCHCSIHILKIPTTLCFRKGWHPTTNDNFHNTCPFLVIFGTNITE